MFTNNRLLPRGTHAVAHSLGCEGSVLWDLDLSGGNVAFGIERNDLATRRRKNEPAGGHRRYVIPTDNPDFTDPPAMLVHVCGGDAFSFTRVVARRRPRCPCVGRTTEHPENTDANLDEPPAHDMIFTS